MEYLGDEIGETMRRRVHLPHPHIPTTTWDGVSEYMLTLAWLTSMPAAASKAWTISVRSPCDAMIKAVEPDDCREQPHIR